MVFGMGMRLHLHMCTTLENGVLRNGQQLQSVVNGFIDQGEFEAMKTSIDCRAQHCDKDQFLAKRMVNTKPLKEEFEKWDFHDCILLRLAVFCMALGHLHESC